MSSCLSESRTTARPMLCVHTEESWEGFKLCPLLLTCKPPKPATEERALQTESWTTKDATHRALLEELESMFGTMGRTRQNPMQSAIQRST